MFSLPWLWGWGGTFQRKQLLFVLLEALLGLRVELSKCIRIQSAGAKMNLTWQVDSFDRDLFQFPQMWDLATRISCNALVVLYLLAGHVTKKQRVPICLPGHAVTLLTWALFKDEKGIARQLPAYNCITSPSLTFSTVNFTNKIGSVSDVVLHYEPGVEFDLRGSVVRSLGQFLHGARCGTGRPAPQSPPAMTIKPSSPTVPWFIACGWPIW